MKKKTKVERILSDGDLVLNLADNNFHQEAVKENVNVPMPEKKPRKCRKKAEPKVTEVSIVQEIIVDEYAIGVTKIKNKFLNLMPEYEESYQNSDENLITNNSNQHNNNNNTYFYDEMGNRVECELMNEEDPQIVIDLPVDLPPVILNDLNKVSYNDVEALSEMDQNYNCDASDDGSVRSFQTVFYNENGVNHDQVPMDIEINQQDAILNEQIVEPQEIVIEQVNVHQEVLINQKYGHRRVLIEQEIDHQESLFQQHEEPQKILIEEDKEAQVVVNEQEKNHHKNSYQQHIEPLVGVNKQENNHQDILYQQHKEPLVVVNEQENNHLENPYQQHIEPLVVVDEQDINHQESLYQQHEEPQVVVNEQEINHLENPYQQHIEPLVVVDEQENNHQDILYHHQHEDWKSKTDEILNIEDSDNVKGEVLTQPLIEIVENVAEDHKIIVEHCIEDKEMIEKTKLIHELPAQLLNSPWSQQEYYQSTSDPDVQEKINVVEIPCTSSAGQDDYDDLMKSIDFNSLVLAESQVDGKTVNEIYTMDSITEEISEKPLNLPQHVVDKIVSILNSADSDDEDA